ncbi:MAG: FAD-dependent oxidoreductase [Pseudomonadota bacterium]
MGEVTFAPMPECDVRVDIAVVGGGAAGLCAAIAARSAGCSVLLLERDATLAGSTAMSQGAVCAAGSRAQARAGIKDDAERFFTDIMAKTDGTADPVIARLVAQASGPTMDWLTETLGLPYAVNAGWSGFFGHSVNRLHSLPSQTGTEMSAHLQTAAQAAGVDIVTVAHVTKLFASADGTVRGALMQRPNGDAEPVACRALVAATCGFGANREMVRQHIPGFGNAPTYRYHGHPGNDGAGIAWGNALGAATGSMDAFQGYGTLADPHGVLFNYNAIMAGGVLVNAHGARFSDELADISGQALVVLDQPAPVWAVFDAEREAAVADLPEYRELSAAGAVHRAEDLAELARLTGADPTILADTLLRAARAAEGSAACPFGRDFRGAAPLAAPYRAVRVTGALFHTQGGLQLDAAGAVIRANGSALPNFFAAGGTARGISGNGASGYLPAAGLCTAVTLGRLAGERAAQAAMQSG